MPSAETLNRFVERVEANAHVEAVEELYTENSSVRENQGEARVGRDAHVAMDELTYQRWEGERIAEETFFFDPAQRVPKPRAG